MEPRWAARRWFPEKSHHLWLSRGSQTPACSLRYKQERSCGGCSPWWQLCWQLAVCLGAALGTDIRTQVWGSSCAAELSVEWSCWGGQDGRYPHLGDGQEHHLSWNTAVFCMKLGSSFPAAICWLIGLRASCLLTDYYANALFLVIISFTKWYSSLFLSLTSEKTQLIVCKGVSKSRGNGGMDEYALVPGRRVKQNYFYRFWNRRTHNLRDVEEEWWVKYTISCRWLK